MIDRLLSFAASEQTYGSIAISGERACALLERGGDDQGPIAIDDGAFSVGEGSMRVSAAGRELVIGLAARTSAIGFETESGGGVEVQAVSVSGELDGLELDGAGVAWSFRSLDRCSVLRTLWAALDERLLVGFSSRPSGASDHAAERSGFATIGADGAVAGYAEPLLSTEYDAAGNQKRATLELWPDVDEGIAERGGGQRVSGGRAALGELELAAAGFAWKLGGVAGPGGYEIVRG